MASTPPASRFAGPCPPERRTGWPRSWAARRVIRAGGVGFGTWDRVAPLLGGAPRWTCGGRDVGPGGPALGRRGEWPGVGTRPPCRGRCVSLMRVMLRNAEERGHPGLCSDAEVLVCASFSAWSTSGATRVCAPALRFLVARHSPHGRRAGPPGSVLRRAGAGELGRRRGGGHGSRAGARMSFRSRVIVCLSRHGFIDMRAPSTSHGGDPPTARDPAASAPARRPGPWRPASMLRARTSRPGPWRPASMLRAGPGARAPRRCSRPDRAGSGLGASSRPGSTDRTSPQSCHGSMP